jgi:hypothetical protein
MIERLLCDSGPSPIQQYDLREDDKADSKINYENVYQNAPPQSRSERENCLVRCSKIDSERYERTPTYRFWMDT